MASVIFYNQAGFIPARGPGVTGVVIADMDSARAAVSALLQAGVENVIITMGSHGAVFGNAEAFFTVPV